MASSPQSQVVNHSFIQQLKPLVTNAQFYWYVGHVLELVFFALYTVTSFFSRSAATSLKYYNYSLLSILFTYLIVLRQTYQNRSITVLLTQYLTTLRDDNIQYVLLALIFYFVSPATRFGQVQGGLYSFTIYSFFHALTYFKTYLLPILPLNQAIKTNYANLIQTFIAKFNENALFLAANSEVLLLTHFVFALPRLVFQLFSQPLKVVYNILMFVVIVVFIKLRYEQNKYAKMVIGNWNMRIDQFLYNTQFIPVGIKNFYFGTIKTLIQKYIGPIRIPVAKKQN